MRKGLIAVATIVIACASVGTASANRQAYIYWLKPSPTDIVGVRSSIGNPDSSQRVVSTGDVMLTSVWATNGLTLSNESAIQQGVLDVNHQTIDSGHGTCQNHTLSNPMYYFVETDKNGTYSCYYEADAASAESHAQRVSEDSLGYWRGYRDGTQQDETQINWTACASNACGLYAFGEEVSNIGGLWQAKFSGSGNVPWSFDNGTQWNTINSYSGPHRDQCWTTNLPTGGGFPGGDPTNLWWFTYNC
jgi:hypothetical protein